MIHKFWLSLFDHKTWNMWIDVPIVYSVQIEVMYSRREIRKNHSQQDSGVVETGDNDSIIDDSIEVIQLS